MSTTAARATQNHAHPLSPPTVHSTAYHGVANGGKDETEEREDERVEGGIDLSRPHDSVDEEREPWRDATDQREQTARRPNRARGLTS